ncbi:MAG: sulfatase-like hydrolase/transferase [Anaerolineae bacterium]|nr:sulfatase-like hydrolase/transferase [Anaerolineae bacterium]
MTAPNILLIFADELRADALGYAGNAIVQTPNIDRLAHSGTRFSQCMVTQPTCTPSRASILTGCYPSALKSRMVGCVTPDDPRFLPRVLTQHGYRTASIGKIHLVPQRDEPDAVQQALDSGGDYYGFQEIDLVDGHGDHCFGPQYTPWLAAQVPDWEDCLKQRQRLQPGLDCFTWELPPEVHSSRYIADRAVDWLNQAGETPFFLHVSFPDPHYPFVVPEPYASQYAPADMPPPLPPVTASSDLPPLHHEVYFNRPGEHLRDHVIGTPPREYAACTTADWQQVKATYYGMITLLDEQIGRILDALDVVGLAENTLVLFLSDHGDYLGDHGFYGKGLPYDPVLGVPLVLRGPGIVPGQVIDSVASTLDLAPTLLDFAGAPEPEGVQGFSLRRALTGQAEPQRQAALTENDDDFVPMRARTLTTDRWKLTVYANQWEGELFDRRSDPAEMINLWNQADYQPIRQRLTQALLDEVMASIDMRNGRTQPPAAPVPKWASGPRMD